ncbi:unnamed protein product [Allacma fusca]|uniref:ZZ-type domain-containing protein n=1 Tax=Allacma fusca TaxID=39272 RepID=A0A8J2PAS8_9HEXA|nr:unnamed protein product [Allacma fusca]
MDMSKLIISERLECPLCNKPIDPRSSNNNKGNVICSNCFPSLTLLACSSSSNKRDKKSSVAVISETTNSDQNEESDRGQSNPDQTCPFSGSGCEAVLSLGEVESHKLDCLFSCMNFCSFLGIQDPRCDETASVDLLDHLVSKHSLESRNASVNGSVQVHQCGDIGDRVGDLRWNPIVIMCEDVKFFLRTTLVNSKTISWNVSVLGSPETAGRFIAVITILSQRGNSLGWKGQVVSIKECDQPSSGFALPITELKEFSSLSNQSDDDEWRLEILIKNKSTQYPSTSKEIPVSASQASPIKRKYDFTETADGIPKHNGFRCDSCSMDPVVGIRYRCMACENYDLCQTCMDSGSNSHADHIFLRIPKYDHITWYCSSVSAALNYGRVTFEIDSETENEDSDSDADS